MRIAVINYNEAGIGKFRVVDPHVKLNSMGVHVDIGKDDILFKQDFDYDILFVHNSIANNELRYARVLELKKRCKVVVDVDDYWMLPHTNPLFGKFKNDNIPSKIANLFRNADLVVASTKYLAAKIRQYNKKIAVIPNAIDKDEAQFHHRPNPHGRFNIGMATGSSHHEDIKLLRGFLNKLPMDKVQFCLAGFDSRIKDINTGQLKHDHSATIWRQYENVILNNMSLVGAAYRAFLGQGVPNQEYSGVEQEPYRRLWTQPIQGYGRLYNWFDMVVAPLVDNEFNNMKSELKIIESGFHGLPIVCSKLQMYSDCIQHGVNGFLVEEKRAHKDFVKYTKILMEDGPLRATMGENLRQYVLGRFELENTTKLRKEIYEGLFHQP